MRVARIVGLLLLSTVLAGVTGVVPAAAAPDPTPPPNPSNDQLQRSRDAVTDQRNEVGRLTARLNELQAELDDLQIQVAAQHESANQALDVLSAAQSEADAAAARAEAARKETDAAGAAVDAAHRRLDDFVASTYSLGIDLGPLGLLTSATGPEDLVDRAQFTDAIAEQQASAIDGLERARVQKANADSAARQARQVAEERRQAAAEAKAAADAALAQAQQQAAEQAKRVSAVTTEQAEVQRRLDAAIDADAGLRAQRARFQQWQREQAEAEAARQRAEQQAAAARAGAGGGSVGGVPARRAGRAAVQTVIDRAMSQLGVTYAWGGGTARGPSLGVRDGGYADAMGDYRKVGFDCSGLMLYAFAGVGVQLPRYSGNQHAFGRQVPLAQMQPGDMLGWARNGDVYHIALYIGNGKMIEAPYSGSSVRISPVRYTGGLLPTVSRVL